MNIFTYDTFLVPISTGDTIIKIKDINGDIKFNLDPLSIINIMVSNNIVRVNITNKVILINFSTNDEAKLSLPLLQNQIDELKSSISISSGTSGDQGEPGTSGSSGSSGTSGDQGEPGTSGTSGSSGTSGDQGEPGTSGSSGSSGTSGTSGTSVIPTGGSIGQVLAKIDNMDFNIEWVDQSGTSGSSGSSGTSGSQGPIGPEGLQGPPGVTGSQGPEGPQGIQGLQGIQGATGPQGPQGIQGPAGTSGTSGKDGDIKEYINLDIISGTVSWDLSDSFNAKLNLDGSNVYLDIISATNGHYGTLIVKQDVITTSSIEFSNNSYFSDGTYSFGGTSSIDIYSFTFDGELFYWNFSKNFKNI